MITFFVNEAGSFGMRDYLANRGREMAGRVNVVLYEQLTAVAQLPATGTIFAALDQTGPATRCAAAKIHDELSAVQPAVPVLNHPEQAMQRYELLRHLFEVGCNRFNVIRATDDPSALRYPVFIRYEHRHNGSLTPLLHDRRAMDLALVDLAVRGIDIQRLLVVEFCDTSGPDGLFRKYSAMRIGEVIVPRHLHAGTRWIAKSRSNAREDENLAREELEYLENHPHARWLRNVFAEARIEYGRVDYGLYKGEPQVWEINTNPTLGRGHSRTAANEGRIAEARRSGRTASHLRMVEAFMRLERPDPLPQLRITLSAALSERVGAEAKDHSRTMTHPLRQSLVKNAMAQPLIRPVIARFASTAARLVRHRPR